MLKLSWILVSLTLAGLTACKPPAKPPSDCDPTKDVCPATDGGLAGDAGDDAAQGSDDTGTRVLGAMRAAGNGGRASVSAPGRWTIAGSGGRGGSADEAGDKDLDNARKQPADGGKGGTGGAGDTDDSEGSASAPNDGDEASSQGGKSSGDAGSDGNGSASDQDHKDDQDDSGTQECTDDACKAKKVAACDATCDACQACSAEKLSCQPVTGRDDEDSCKDSRSCSSAGACLHVSEAQTEFGDSIDWVDLTETYAQVIEFTEPAHVEEIRLEVACIESDQTFPQVWIAKVEDGVPSDTTLATATVHYQGPAQGHNYALLELSKGLDEPDAGPIAIVVGKSDNDCNVRVNRAQPYEGGNLLVQRQGGFWMPVEASMVFQVLSSK